jgi:hypothetical protein
MRLCSTCLDSLLSGPLGELERVSDDRDNANFPVCIACHSPFANGDLRAVVVAYIYRRHQDVDERVGEVCLSCGDSIIAVNSLLEEDVA